MGAQAQADLLEAGHGAAAADSRKRLMLVSATGKLIMFCLVDLWNQQLEGLQPAQAQVERFQRLLKVALAHLDAGLARNVGEAAQATAGNAAGGLAVVSSEDV